MENQKLVDAKEAAELLGYSSPQLIWILKKLGQLTPVATPEPKLYFSKEEVLALKEKIGVSFRKGPKRKEETQELESQRKAS
jgi:hypothetical protein